MISKKGQIKTNRLYEMVRSIPQTIPLSDNEALKIADISMLQSQNPSFNKYFKLVCVLIIQTKVSEITILLAAFAFNVSPLTRILLTSVTLMH